MICHHCRTRAVGCGACKKTVTVNSDGTLRKHKPPGRWNPWCVGSGERPVIHPGCSGCACQHRPPGAWEGIEQ